MKSISSLLERAAPHRAAPPHSKAAAVNEILDALKDEPKQYSYGYWLRKVGRASYGTVMSIAKAARDLPAKYSRGGFVTNRLKEANSQTAV